MNVISDQTGGGLDFPRESGGAGGGLLAAWTQASETLTKSSDQRGLLTVIVQMHSLLGG